MQSCWSRWRGSYRWRWGSIRERVLWLCWSSRKEISWVVLTSVTADTVFSALKKASWSLFIDHHRLCVGLTFPIRSVKKLIIPVGWPRKSIRYKTEISLWCTVTGTQTMFTRGGTRCAWRLLWTGRRERWRVLGRLLTARRSWLTNSQKIEDMFRLFHKGDWKWREKGSPEANKTTFQSLLRK